MNILYVLYIFDTYINYYLQNIMNNLKLNFKSIIQNRNSTKVIYYKLWIKIHKTSKPFTKVPIIL